MLDNKTIIHSKDFTYTIARKNVKNINLRINREGEVIVSAPMSVTNEQIESFVTKKKDWIVKHQQIILEHQKQKRLNESEILLFGKKLKIKTIKAQENQITYDDMNLYVMHRGNKKPETLIQDFLNQLCLDVYHDVTQMTIRIMKEHPTKTPDIKIRQMKSQWGNCHVKEHYITLNKQLIHYPFEFIEYVILHELTHFHVMNHSSAFYQIIEKYMPDYKRRIQMMKEV